MKTIIDKITGPIRFIYKIYNDQWQWIRDLTLLIFLPIRIEINLQFKKEREE